jgi:tRNA(Ile)-lysidine synthase
MTPPDRVAEFFGRHGLHGTAGVVAISGGPDSVALAHALTRLLHDGVIPRLVLAHVNHLLRGDESDEDEAFVVGLPERWAVAGKPGPTVQFVRTDTAELAREAGDNLEAFARTWRYAWLADLARQEGAAWVATGHTADDQAETVLFRLFRGSGLDGLAGIPELRPLTPGVELIRPLLGVRREDVIAYLVANNLPFRQDATNADARFTRNRIRHDLLPRLQADYNPAVVDVLCRLADQAAAVQTIIEPLAEALLAQAELPRAGDVLVFDADVLAGAPAHLVRELFRVVWRREGWPAGEMGYAEWDTLARIAAGDVTAWDFPGRVRVRRVGRVVQIAPLAA